MSSAKWAERYQEFPEPFEEWSVGQRVAIRNDDNYLLGRVVRVYRYHIRVHLDIGYDTCFVPFDAQRELEKR